MGTRAGLQFHAGTLVLVYGGPIAALLLYCLCVRVTMAMGIHGFFFPGTWIVVLVCGGCAAWRLGHECRLVFPPQCWLKTSVFALGCVVLIPVAARITEGALARFLLRHDTRLEYRLPGLDVIVEPRSRPFQLRSEGLTFSSTTVLSDGTVMTMFNHTEGRTPPYCLIGGFLAMSVALCSGRAPWRRTGLSVRDL